MKYELTESNVKDLIEWLRGGHINRAVIALEHLNPVADIAAKVEPTVGDSMFESWYSEVNQAGKGSKQLAREAYEAGMLDPSTSPKQAEAPAELIDALQELMAWQVKNVKCWHNSAYDNAVRAIARFNAAP